MCHVFLGAEDFACYNAAIFTEMWLFSVLARYDDDNGKTPEWPRIRSVHERHALNTYSV